jgi:hypothetical protein
VREIHLTKGAVALVDDEDFEALSGRRWYATVMAGGLTYAATRIDRRNVTMHRLLLDAPEGHVIDHANGNTLDNRRANLRVATVRQNNINAATPCTNTSGYRGVSWEKEKGKWRAQIRLNGKVKRLGRFADIKDAARAYNAAAVAHFGEFARIEPVL